VSDDECPRCHGKGRFESALPRHGKDRGTWVKCDCVATLPAIRQWVEDYKNS
jgi:hypothetical protein